MGGAEAEARRTVEHLYQAGVEIEVLTTCVHDFRSDWGRNHYLAGVTRANGVPVQRFPVKPRDRAAFDAVNLKLMHDQPVTPVEEQIYVRENVCSPALTDYIARHQGEYLYIFIPYLFGTTYWGIDACKGKAVLIPCLHDEAYARLGVIQKMFAQVQRIMLFTEAERRLARLLYRLPDDRLMLLGAGVDTDWSADGDAFRHKYGIRDSFILYAGRKDTGKNVDLLIDYFRRYRANKSGSLELILIGGGPLPVEVKPNEGIRDLGYVPLQDKYNAYGAAALLCQPSLKESFSIVLMEAWMAGTPVLVHERCAVTREHCIHSNGGLYFADYAEFEACLDLMLNRPGMRAAMGVDGRRYVLDNYCWDIIVGRYRALLDRMAKD